MASGGRGLRRMVPFVRKEFRAEDAVQARVGAPRESARLRGEAGRAGPGRGSRLPSLWAVPRVPSHVLTAPREALWCPLYREGD